MEEAIIVSAVRTPIGRARKGALAGVRPDDLSALAIAGALARVPQLVASDVEDVVWGCAQPAGESGYLIARVAAVLAGLPDVPGVTVNRYCASSLQAIRSAVHAVRAGEGDAFVAGGVECVSRFGDALPADTGPHNRRFAHSEERSAARSRSGEPWSPAEGLADIYMSMGETAENVASLEGVSREDMDEFAVRSQRLAADAWDRGFFDREVIAVPLECGSSATRDDSLRPDTTLDGLGALAPVFRAGGTVTAGNSCPLNDGAAAVVVMSQRRARDLEVTPLARVLATGVSGLNPEIMGLGPVEATRRALSRAGLTVADVDLFEINEAFAAQVIPSARHLGIDPDRLNVNGGAIALGHPFGMTGARIAGTLINSMRDRDATIGVETMCVGGGQGMALVLERI